MKSVDYALVDALIGAHVNGSVSDADAAVQINRARHPVLVHTLNAPPDIRLVQARPARR